MHSLRTRSACDAAAWTYYQAVVDFGELVNTDEGLQRAAPMKAAAEASAK